MSVHELLGAVLSTSAWTPLRTAATDPPPRYRLRRASCPGQGVIFPSCVRPSSRRARRCFGEHLGVVRGVGAVVQLAVPVGIEIDVTVCGGGGDGVERGDESHAQSVRTSCSLPSRSIRSQSSDLAPPPRAAGREYTKEAIGAPSANPSRTRRAIPSSRRHDYDPGTRLPLLRSFLRTPLIIAPERPAQVDAKAGVARVLSGRRYAVLLSRFPEGDCPPGCRVLDRADVDGLVGFPLVEQSDHVSGMSFQVVSARSRRSPDCCRSPPLNAVAIGSHEPTLSRGPPLRGT